jgi:hypothetical protein
VYGETHGYNHPLGAGSGFYAVASGVKGR